MKMEKKRGIMSDIVKVDKISMRFNMSSEIIHSFKEYIIKLLKVTESDRLQGNLRLRI